MKLIAGPSLGGVRRKKKIWRGVPVPDDPLLSSVSEPLQQVHILLVLREANDERIASHELSEALVKPSGAFPVDGCQPREEVHQEAILFKLALDLPQFCHEPPRARRGRLIEVCRREVYENDWGREKR